MNLDPSGLLHSLLRSIPVYAPLLASTFRVCPQVLANPVTIEQLSGFSHRLVEFEWRVREGYHKQSLLQSRPKNHFRPDLQIWHS